MAIAAIKSKGDLEVIVLHEAHNALAALIGPELYRVNGIPPEQTCQFHTRVCFDLFLILLVEFFAEGTQSAQIGGKYQNYSLMRGLQRLCSAHPTEARRTGLDSAVSNLEAWTKRRVQIQFWCSDVNTNIEFMLSNHQLISFGANSAKHHLLRVSQLLGKLESLCDTAGYNFSSQALIAVLFSMIEEVRSRLSYHATYLLELLGAVFLALNQLVLDRFKDNPTNRVGEMSVPEGVTSDVFRDLYSSVMVFKRYGEERIREYTPVTTQWLKLRYQ